MWLIGLLFTPLLIAIGFLLVFKNTVTKKEFVMISAIGVAAVFLAGAIAAWQSLSSEEHWNGRLTAKTDGSQHCCHCHEECDTCRDSNGNSHSCNCREVCAHSRDYWWKLSVSTGDELTIEDCEPNSHAVPTVWTNARIGEPASVAHSYTNYLKADENSLLRHVANEEFLAAVPSFPTIRDFYKTNKVVSVGVAFPEQWESGLKEINADIGKTKQVDVTVVFTKYAETEFADAVEAKWLYGPKNAVIIVAGVPDGQKIAWVRVVTISKVEDLKVGLRDKLTGLPLNDAERALGIIKNEVMTKFTRTPMDEFSYLSAGATPTTGWLILSYLFAIALSVGLGIWVHRVDVFGGEKVRSRGGGGRFNGFRGFPR